jgi:TonB-dependent Receptor Plug Domain
MLIYTFLLNILNHFKMKTRLTLFIVLFITVFSSFKIISSGDELIKKIIGQIESYMYKTPQEKVYMHLDKPYYMVGETIWLKGYLLGATMHNIDSVSGVLYVDLIHSNSQKIVKHLTLQCISGTTNGDIKLDTTLAEGNYILRGYTHFMQNYSEDFYFKKDIKIWQNKPSSAKDYPNTAELIDVAECQFFPEGGNLVDNITSRVGFKGINKWGRGVDVSGTIINNSTQDSVTFMKSEHIGMGTFSFTPLPNTTYSAKIKKSDGTFAVFNLPNTQPQGYVMQVDNISGRKDVKVYIALSNPQPEDKAEDLILIGNQRGNTCFTAKIPNKRKSILVNIPRQDIPDDGILQLTLFNPKGEPTCERLVFIKKQEQQVHIKITPDKANYKIREKVTLNIEAIDSSGQPVQGNFSLVATDAKQVTPPQYEGNILSYILLTSDLKGYIEDPAYYFTPKDLKATIHLDYLMMTQGWRRFIWKDVLSEQYPRLDYAVESNLSITGRALRYNKKPSPKAKMTLLLKQKEAKNPFIAIEECDSTGRFAFYNLFFQDTCQVLVQAVKEKGGKGLDILLDTTPIPKVYKPNYPTLPITFDAASLAEFIKRAAESLEQERQLQLREDKMLQTLEVKAKKVQKNDSRRIYGENTGKTIKLTDADCISYPSVYDIIQAQVPGIQITFVDGEQVANSRGGKLTFAIDGFITDDAFVSSIYPCDIESIDVLRGAEAAIFGMSGGGGSGVVNILTKSGNPNYTGGSSRPTPGIVTGNRMGYNIAREFYAPQYDVSKPEHDLPDFRSTIHWQPYIKTDKQGKATVTFWNTDAKTKVKVQIEGFSNKGRMGVGKLEYEVL